jgi:hypothetical protein
MAMIMGIILHLFVVNVQKKIETNHAIQTIYVYINTYIHTYTFFLPPKYTKFLPSPKTYKVITGNLTQNRTSVSQLTAELFDLTPK